MHPAAVKGFPPRLQELHPLNILFYHDLFGLRGRELSGLDQDVTE
jgi:hypothetical protein